MTTLLFSWCATIALVIMEFIFGNWGFFVPLAGGCILYFTMTTSWKNTLFIALIAGLVLDGIYARNFPLETCFLAAAMIFNRRFLPEIVRENGMLSALCCGLLYSVCVESALLCLTASSMDLWQKALEFPIVVLGWTLLFCLLVFVLDAISHRIGALPYCVELNENPVHYHGGRKVSQQKISPKRGFR